MSSFAHRLSGCTLTVTNFQRATLAWTSQTASALSLVWTTHLTSLNVSPQCATTAFTPTWTRLSPSLRARKMFGLQRNAIGKLTHTNLHRLWRNLPVGSSLTCGEGGVTLGLPSNLKKLSATAAPTRWSSTTIGSAYDWGYDYMVVAGHFPNPTQIQSLTLKFGTL